MNSISITNSRLGRNIEVSLTTGRNIKTLAMNTNLATSLADNSTIELIERLRDNANQ